MNHAVNTANDTMPRRSLLAIPLARSFVTVLASLLGLIVVCYFFAPSSLTLGALNGSLPFASIIATIGVNALLYGGVFAVSGGTPRITTKLLAAIAGGETLGVPNSVYFALAALLLVSFMLKKTVAGRRFEAIGANPLAARAVGLNTCVHRMMAYVFSQMLCCLA